MLRLILLVAAGLLFWTSPLARVMGVDLLRSTADLLEPEDADKERQKIQDIHMRQAPIRLNEMPYPELVPASL